MSLNNWYALAVTSGNEHKVRKNILNRLDRRGVIIPNLSLLCPEEEVVVGKGSAREKKMQMQLPGYILLHCRSINDRAIREIANTSGVIEFLGGNDNPSPLPADQVSQMVGGPTSKRSRAPLFKLDDEVTITDGPLSGFIGRITEVNEDQDQVQVDVEIFGQLTKAQVSIHNIKK